MVTKLGLQRDELALAIGPNHKAIRQFEELFGKTNSSSNALDDIVSQLVALLAAAQNEQERQSQAINIISDEIGELKKLIHEGNAKIPDHEAIKNCAQCGLVQGQFDELNQLVDDIQAAATPSEPELLNFLETKRSVAANKPGRINWTATGQFNAGQSTINIPIGALNMIRAQNNSGLFLSAGRCVRLISAAAGVPAFTTTGNETNFDCIGVTAEDIPAGGIGYICCTGVIEGMDASGVPFGEVWLPGDVLYLGTSPALTNVPPIKPRQIIQIGLVLSASSVIIYPNRNIKTESISDFVLSTLTNGQLPIFDAVAGVWRNKTLTAGAGGVQVANSPGMVTIDLGNITNNQAAKIIASSVALTSTAGANTGTLNNCPVAGDPTAYFSITDPSGTYVAPFWKLS